MSECEKYGSCDTEYSECECVYDGDCETCKDHKADAECRKCDTCTYQN